jgi:predicted nucleic acid-binding Zn finger protein
MVLAELDRIRLNGKVARRDMAELRRVFGARFTGAWGLIREGRVKKYVFKPSGRVQWIVAGKERDYLIYEASGYCHCRDFYMAIMDGKAKACKHLIAQRIASQTGLYSIVVEDDENRAGLLEEWILS